MFARCPSPVRVLRAATAILRELPAETRTNRPIAPSTTSDRSGSSTAMTTTMTTRVTTLATRGRPAVITTSCMRATSLTMRWTVSALRLRAWNWRESPWTCRKMRARSELATREPARAKATVAR